MKGTGRSAILIADRNTGADPLGNPGSLLGFAGDWHGRTEAALDALDSLHARGVRTLVHTGNFGVWPQGRSFLDALAGRLALLGMSAMFVAGNNEDYSQIGGLPFRGDGLQVVRPRLYHLPRAFRWTWPGGLRCLALGGGVSLDRPFRTPNVDWWPQEELTAGDVQRARDGGPADLMITHDCPQGVFVPGLPPDSAWPEQELALARSHRASLRSVVDEVRPARLIHGHMHSRYDSALSWPDGRTCAVTGLDQKHRPGNLLVMSLADLRSDVARRDAAVDG